MKFEMKIFAILLALFLLVLSQASHSCTQNVKWTQSGTTLECDAWVVKDAQMQKFDKAMKENTILNQLNETNNQLLKLTEAEMEFYKRQSQSAQKELARAESRSFWTGVGGFALGVILTGIAAKAAIEATK